MCFPCQWFSRAISSPIFKLFVWVTTIILHLTVYHFEKLGLAGKVVSLSVSAIMGVFIFASFCLEVKLKTRDWYLWVENIFNFILIGLEVTVFILDLKGGNEKILQKLALVRVIFGLIIVVVTFVKSGLMLYHMHQRVGILATAIGLTTEYIIEGTGELPRIVRENQAGSEEIQGAGAGDPLPHQLQLEFERTRELSKTIPSDITENKLIVKGLYYKLAVGIDKKPWFFEIQNRKIWNISKTFQNISREDAITILIMRGKATTISLKKLYKNAKNGSNGAVAEFKSSLPYFMSKEEKNGLEMLAKDIIESNNKIEAFRTYVRKVQAFVRSEENRGAEQEEEEEVMPHLEDV